MEGFAERFTEAQKLSQVTSVFLRGAIKSPPTLIPLLPWSSWRAHNIVACPPHYHPSRNDPASLDAVWEISKENVLVYYRNLGSLRYGTSPAFLDVLWTARLSRFIWRNLRRGGEEMPLLSWRAMAGCIAIGSRTAAEPFVRFLVLHEPMDVQLHCVIKKGFSWREKKKFPNSVSWRSTSEISKGNNFSYVEITRKWEPTVSCGYFSKHCFT